MEFLPKTQAELARAGLLADGQYKMSVVNAEDKTSKSGNQMIELILECPNPSGGSKHRVWDYLVVQDNCIWKIQQFCTSCGLTELYNKGKLSASDCLGCIVMAEVGMREAGGGYQAKNEITGYAEHDGKEPPPKVAEISEDDIPF